MSGAILFCLLAADPVSWWQNYGDPVLEKLLAKVFEANRDLQVAEQRVAEVRALVRESGSALPPSINANAGVQRLRGGY